MIRKKKKTSISQPMSLLVTAMLLSLGVAHGYEAFPQDLNTLGYAESGEFHLHGRYEFNVSTGSGGLRVPLTLGQASYLRFSMSNLSGYDTSVRLTRTTGSSTATLVSDKYNHFHGPATEGPYLLTFSFSPRVVFTAASAPSTSYMTSSMTSSTSTAYSQVADAYVEFEVVGLEAQKKRSEAYDSAMCPVTVTVPSYPNIDFGPLADHSSVHYSSIPSSGKSATEYYVLPTATTGSGGNGDVFAHAWVFDIPAGGAKAATFSATLYAAFASSGFLQLTLQSNASSDASAVPPPPSDVAACVRSGVCVAGTRRHAGELTVRSALAPGRYALWLHWAAKAVPEASSKVTPRCVPFALTVDIVEAPFAEDLLTCADSTPLPPMLIDSNGNGIEGGSGGEFYYGGRVLVGSTYYSHTTNITVPVESLARFYVHDHPLDLDVEIKNTATGTAVAYGMRSSGPEVVVARLAAGVYSVVVTSFSLARTKLCDAFGLEVALTPVASPARVDFCAGHTETRSPALAELLALERADGTVHVATEHVFMYENLYSHRKIVSQDFTVGGGTAKRLRVRVASHFVLNDITFELTRKSTRETVYPAHTRNAHTLDALLLPGEEYSLALYTGIAQATRPPKEEFYPPCALYTLEMDAFPEDPAARDPADARCGAYRPLPPTLATPEFLGTSRSVHIMETFRMPNVTGHSSSSSSLTGLSPSADVRFGLDVTSYLRVFVPRHHVDIDVYLLNGTDTLRAAMSFLADESVSIVLPPGNNYALRFEFIHYAHSGEEPPCYTFPLELSITPWNISSPLIAPPATCPSAASTASAAEEKDHLPPSRGFVPAEVERGESTGTWVSEGSYWAQRSGTARPLNITFTLARMSAFRAILRSDFVYGQLSLKLVSTAADTSFAVPATLGYNAAEIPVDILTPGTYSLVIYEPYSLINLPQEVLSACVRFYLTVAIGPAGDDGIGSSSSSSSSLCEYTGLPAHLNHPGALHTLNGYKATLGGTYLLSSAEERRDYVDFHIEEAMLYRVYVPETHYVDVDVYLRHGTRSSPGPTIDHCAGVEEEMLFGELTTTGDYHFQIEYLNLGSALSSSDVSASCLGFPIVIALEPATPRSSDPKHKDLCEATYPKAQAVLDTDVSEKLNWSPNALDAYHAEISFVVDTDTALCDAEMRFDFVPSGLSFHLEGAVRSGLLEIDADFDATPGANRLYIREYLARGNYTLVIEDLATARTQQIKCAQYQLLYRIDTKVRGSPEACMEVERLPTDLYTLKGGSREYGGPQRADGTVLVSGEHFFVSSRPEYATQWTRFNVSETSFVRVFTRAQAPNDIDIYLYRNRTNPLSLVDGSVSLGEYESALWHITDTGLYDIKTQFFAVDYDTPCNYFRWAAAVRPSRVLATELLCPATLPPEVDRVPPPTITVLPGAAAAQTRFGSDEYVLTKEFIQAHVGGESGTPGATGSNTFRYYMVVDVQAAGGATVTASLRYNFITNDFRLRLRDYNSGEVKAVGATESLPSAMHYSRFNFRSVLRVRLPAGKHYITLEEGGLANKAPLTDLVPRYCSFFAFEFTATSEDGGGGGGGGGGSSNTTVQGPRIETVTPALLTRFEPCEDLYIQIAFSDAPVTIPRGLTESTAYINSHKTMYLSDVAATSPSKQDEPAFPVDLAIFEEDGKTLTLRYSNENFNHTAESYSARTFRLRIDLGQLQDAQGRTFSDPSPIEYIYAMAPCECTGNNGVCRVVALADTCLQCVCRDRWAGPQCAACAAGYHSTGGGGSGGSGGECVADEKCAPESCHGHGTCDDSTGTVRCVCDEGYASSATAGMCGECAYGYAGYPACSSRGNASDERAGLCHVAYLPRTLNAVAHLGWTGQADLSGEYYVDTGAKVHNTYFNLDRATVLRVYAEPHKVDIDLWLYELKSDGATIDHVVDYTMTFNGAEVLYKVLPGGSKANPRRYLLQFRYYVWNAAVLAPCETFELELGLHPWDAAAPRLAELARHCAPADTFPAPDAPPLIVADYAYEPAQNFTLRAPVYHRQEPIYFWHYDFRVEGRPGHSILLRTDVGSRFVPGQVMMVLENVAASAASADLSEAYAAADHCAGETSSFQSAASSSSSSNSRCVTGDSTMNGNYIERVISPGSYRLWLYQPVPQNASVAPCALYDFSFRVEYVDATATLWECTAGTPLPTSLNVPGYLDEDYDTAHIQDTFLVHGNASFTFVITQPCHFRVAGNDGALFAVHPTMSFASTDLYRNLSYAPNVLARLEAGLYTVVVIPPPSSNGGGGSGGTTGTASGGGGSTGTECIYVDMELALEPVSAVVLEPCLGSGANVAEVMPDVDSEGKGLTAPFYFGPRANANLTDPTFVALPYGSTAHTTRVAQYTIVATEMSVLFAGVSSSFLYHSLGLALYRNVDGAYVKVADSSLLQNYQYIKHTLVAGRYLLTLDIPTLADRPASLPTCLPFNLEIYHYNYGLDTRCLLAGEPAPATFDSYRFLRPGGAFDFADTDFRIPLNISLRKSTYISFENTRTSLLRVYTEPNTAVDIDIRLFDSKSTVVAASEGYVYTEESLVAVLPPGLYTLELIFWVWDQSLVESGCPTFRMQASMKPVPALTAEESPSRSHFSDDDSSDGLWPEDIKETLGGREEDSDYTYSYESRWQEDHYYVQQPERAASHTVRFTLGRPCNIFAQTKYRFAEGQLALKLNRMAGSTVSPTTVAETYTGHIGPNRYTLTLKGAPAGTYELVLYEPQAMPAEAITGGQQQRVYFGFALTVSRQAALFTNDHTSLPATLDSIGYLGYDRSVHVFDPFVMFRRGPAQRERTAFSIYEPSTVHAYAAFETDPAKLGPVRIALNRTDAPSAAHSIVAVGDTELHALVSPGRYSLEFLRARTTGGESGTLSGEGRTVNVEISVEPVAKLRDEVVAHIPYEPACPDNVLPSITPDASGRYSFTSNTRTVSHRTYASKQALVVVDHKAIEVKARSTFFAQLGYEFALGRLALMIELQQGGTVNGTAYRNLNTIRTVLPPGTHHLVILRTAAPPAIKDLNYCTPFSITISLAPVGSSSGSDACTYLDVVPWDLNRYDGGSALYGGPLDSTGSLLLYSDRFGVPAGTTSSSMQLELYKDSVVSILLAAGDGLTSVHAHLYELESGSIVDPAGAAQTYGDRQQVATFYVSPSTRRTSKYVLTLHYTLSSSASLGSSSVSSSSTSACAAFTMQVVVRPVQAIKDSIKCPSGFVAQPPDPTIDLDANGFASDYHSSALLSTDPIQRGAATYAIDFTLPRFSKFSAALSFNPLVNLYALQLFRDYRTPSAYQMSYGSYRAQQYDLTIADDNDNDNTAAATASITQIITDNLIAGNYTLLISQRDWTAPADILAGKTPLCLPFVYTAHVIPQAGGHPYVSDVSPASAKRVSPAAPLALSVAFSSQLRSAADPARPASSDDIRASFRLVSDGSTSVAPSEASLEQDGSATSTSSDIVSKWTLTFPAGKLASKRTYKLTYTQGKVLDEQNKSVAYVFTNLYKTLDATCSGNGKLTNNACLCNEGYGGAACQLCDIGYVDVGKAGEPLRCIPSMSCDEGTCGCEYTNATHCNSLGYCALTDLGKATCDCNKGYAGPYCRSCAKGWSGWPHCIPCYNGASYIESSKKCVCVGNFAGSKCQRCAFGYTGKDCNTLGGVIAVVTLAIIAALVIVVVAILVRNKIIEDPRRSYKRIINTAASKIKNVTGSGSGSNNSIFYFDNDDDDDGDDDGDDDDDDGGEPTNSIFTPIESSFGNINLEGNGIDDDEPSDFVLPSYNSNTGNGSGDSSDSSSSNNNNNNNNNNGSASIDDFFAVKK